MLLLKIYLYVYYFYELLWDAILYLFGSISIIYEFDGETKKNITWHFWGSNPTDKTYFIKKIYRSGTYYLAYTGDKQCLSNLTRCDNEIVYNPLKRKNIILLNNDNVIAFDLNVLDNYKRGIDTFPQYINKKNNFDPITDLATVLKLFNCNITHVKFMQLIPLKINVVNANKVTIDMLYQ